MEKPSGGLAAPLELKVNSHDRKAGRKARVPLSCGPCRYRKLKCNRQQPCQNCIVRKEPGACVFARSGDATQSAISNKHIENMQSQIDRLERLVTSFASQQNDDGGLRIPSNGTSTHGSTTPDDSSGTLRSGTTDNPDAEKTATAAGRGMVKVDQDQSVYVGPGHWSDVLNELNALKTSWSNVQEEQYELALTASLASTTIGGPSFLCGMVDPIDMPELLASLPPKPIADKLIGTFFDENDSLVPSLHILHRPTFMRQYEEHWNSPYDTKLMWLGLLFSILSLTVAAQNRPTEEPVDFEGAPSSLFDLYRLRTAQCLMMADITKCLPYTVETLMYNILAEQVGKKDSSAGVWALSGAIVRVAVQMGYHRDPSLYPNIPVFQGEMRRRVWCALVTTDSVSSFLVGLPSIVHSLDHDTADPRNIHDWELYEGMTELPESRPATDVTQTSYSLAKARLLQPLGEVVDFVNSLQPNSYQRVLQIDKKLSSARDSMPFHLQVRNIEHMSGNSPNRINRMVQIEFLFHQGVCVLHRRFLVRGRFDSQFSRSREQCIKSALALLNHQRVLYDVGKSTGSVKALYWFQISGISQAFILPAVILCLDLRHQKNAGNATHRSDASNEEPRSEEMLEAIKTAQRIWDELKDISPETNKINRVLCQLLDSIDAYEHDDALSSKDLGRHISIQGQNLGGQSYMSGFDERSNTPINEMDIDWSAWDAFVEGSSFEDAYGTMQFNDSGDFTFGAGDCILGE